MDKENGRLVDEEQKDFSSTAPPRHRDRFIKVITLTLFFMILLFSVGFFGVETTTSSTFCSSCHEMTPEFYTWKASSHSEVDCVSCHTGPNPKGYAEAKASRIFQFFNKSKPVYNTKEQMSKKIPDSVCEKCHNLNQRQVTPTGDLIIPHEKHKSEKVKCIECHSGTSHGNIAKRQMTLPFDYHKWNAEVGHDAMKDQKYIKPSMQACIDCHTLKKAPLNCSDCHKTGMYPESHRQATFSDSLHGKIAIIEIKQCHQCHSLMSSEKVLGIDQSPTLSQFIKAKDIVTSKKNAYDYAKENTFCRDCHSHRPSGHEGPWMFEHGGYARENGKYCFACHEKQWSEKTPLIPPCFACHNESVINNLQYKKNYLESYTYWR